MSEADERGRRFLEAMGGRTYADVGKAVGVAVSTIAGYVKGNVPNAEQALAVCEVLDLDLAYWVHGVSKKTPQSEVFFLPWRNGPTGNEAIPYAMNLIEMLERPPDSLFCGFGTGNLMAPTIPQGAEVIFSTEISRLNDGCVYLIRAGNDEVLRRLRIRLDGKLEAFCDNRDFASQIETVSLDDLVAEAVWVSRKP